MTPVFFETPAAFRRWLRAHHQHATELWVGYHKRSTGRATITWEESVEEALCFGWIDGVRRRVDAGSYTNRFTPRRPGSNWSLVNIAKAEALIASGRMRPAGRKAFEARDAARSGVYSFERAHARFAPADAARLKRSSEAWAFWRAQPPGYRKLITHWVTSAKRAETRDRRLTRLIAACAAGQRVGATL